MTFGNQQNNNAPKDPTYYSKLRINHESNGTSVSISYWRGLMRLSIAEYSQKDNKGSDLAFNILSPIKAREFAKCIKTVMDSEEDVTYAVDTGFGETRGFVAIGKEYGKPFLFIGKVNSSGAYEGNQKFEFNKDYNYYLKVHDIDNLKCTKIFDNSVELEMLYDACMDYSRAASGASAAAVFEVGKYEIAKISGVINAIAEKVGAERKFNSGNYNSGSSRSNSSFFNGVSSDDKSSSISNLGDELEDDD